MKKRSELRYMVIAQDIERSIKRGEIVDKLPTQRELIQKYKTSIRTIQEVYSSLKARGLITTTNRGTFVVQQSTPVFKIPTQRTMGSK